jgi:demethylmenaquinone methyltransferase / 2-methoxy-6-polyprenyl-1,4-benzoquinol methylase
MLAYRGRTAGGDEEQAVHEVQRSRTEPNAFARTLFDRLPARYDLLAELLSFGQNRRWRAAMVDAVADMSPAPRRILDVATGTAGVAMQLADRTRAEVVGVDLTEPMLRQGKRRVDDGGRGDRITLMLGRAEQLPFADEAFDAVTFTYLLRYVSDPAATLRELARVLRPGGTLASLEFLLPPRPVYRFGWNGYVRAVLPAAGFLTGGTEWFSVGRFLGPSIREHYRRYPLEWTTDAWAAAGLEGVTARQMSLGGGLVMWGRKAGG